MSHRLEEVIENLSIDCTIFGFERSCLEILLIKRAIEPCQGMWALPGGFIKQGERVEHAALRILEDTTGVKDIYLEEVGVFDELNRYPLRRVISIAYFALISPENYLLTPGNDTYEVKWFKLDELPDLPFDHKEIINGALEKLRKRVRTKPLGFELLPEKFSLPQLQRLYEEILGKTLDKRNFRKKLMKMDLLIKLTEKETNNKKRAAVLYSFDNETYNRLKDNGFMFEL